MREHLRLAPGPVDLRAMATDATPGFTGDKADGVRALAALGAELADLQERLFAAGRSDPEHAPRLLLIVQGMDTAGKGGAMREVCGLLDPQGVRIVGFKAPTPQEREHDFLWRIRKALPEAGYVGAFDRSHYEDVLIARVRELASAQEIEQRYELINAFESELVEQRVVLVKCLLHIGAEEQKRRLLARLDDPSKYWKFNPGDIDERALWPEYRRAYEVALERTNTDHAPWHVVPAEKKWYRNLAIAHLVLDALRGLDLGWPPADFDVAVQRARLEHEEPVS